jgi:hypothetical protein
MILAPQKLLAKSKTGRNTLSLLFILGEIGGKHLLLCLIRRDGKLSEVREHDFSEVPFLAQELAEEGEAVHCYPESTAPESRCRIEIASSSRGDFKCVLIQEKVVISRTLHGYEVQHAEETIPSSAIVTQGWSHA